MKTRKQLIIAGCLAMLLISCNKPLTTIDDQITNYSHGRFELCNQRATHDGLGEFPFLPKGFFLYRNDANVPVLAHSCFPEGGKGFPCRNIVGLRYDKDSIWVCRSDSSVLSSSLSKPLMKESGPNNCDCLQCSERIDVNLHYPLFAIQDNKANADIGVNYSTPILSDIVCLGIIACDSAKYCVGETLYAFFRLDLETGDLYFFYDRYEYQNCLIENSFYRGLEVLMSPFAVSNKQYRNSLGCAIEK